MSYLEAVRIPLFVLLASAVALAEIAPGVSFSGECAWIASSPETKAPVEGRIGHGFRIQPGLESPLSDHFSLRTHAGYQTSQWGTSRTRHTFSFFGDATQRQQVDSTYRMEVVSLGSALQFGFLDPYRVILSLGASLDIPWQKRYEVRSWAIAPTGERTEQPSLRGSFGDSSQWRYFDFGVGVQSRSFVGIFATYRVPMASSAGAAPNQFAAGMRCVF